MANGYTAKQFIDAIPGSGGVISTIAARVGCAWNTAQKYIKEFATVAEAYENERNRIDDIARSNVIDDIKAGSIETSKWWLRVKAPDEFEPRQKLDVNMGEVDAAIERELARVADKGKD